MQITQRVSLFGYSASEVEKSIDKLNLEFEEKKKELEDKIQELKKEIDELHEQIEYNKNNRSVVVKKRVVHRDDVEGKEQKEIAKALFDAHIKSTDKVIKVQKNVAMKLEKRKSLILIREKKANEMKTDLQNLIDYIDSIAKGY